VALLLSGAEVGAGLFSGPDPNWREGEIVYPPAFSGEGLREFYVSAASPNRFLVDENSLSVDSDGVVRYVLVVRTSGGAENVTFEGIRCESGERRIYATARADGGWSPARRSGWEPIGSGSYNQPRSALARNYFCDGSTMARDRAEVLRKLREAVRILP